MTELYDVYAVDKNDSWWIMTDGELHDPVPLDTAKKIVARHQAFREKLGLEPLTYRIRIRKETTNDQKQSQRR